MKTGIAAALAASELRGELIRPGDADYESRRRVWNGVADKRPAAIVRARDETDIAKTVRVAAEGGALLAVRGGGHSLPGFSTCDGIVLDLSLMNQVSVDPVARTARVGGGALLGDLDRGGAPHGLVTPAGVVSHTGAAGLTLGGGMGWTSRRLGLTIDSLSSAEVVLADGRRVTASLESEPDLFWGLRGGGGNFGVVTSFTYRMHELGEVLVGSWQYALADARTVLRHFGELTADAPRNLTASSFLVRDGLSVTACWSGKGDGAEAAVARFGRLAAPVSAQLGGMTFLELQSRGDDRNRWGRRYYAKGGFFAGLDDAIVDWLVDAIGGAPSADAEFFLNTLGGAISDVGENDTAYSGRAAKYYWIAEPIWDDPADDARCLAWGRASARRLTEMSMAGNYVNEQADAAAGFAREAFGQDKYRRLSLLKARVDPGNLFRLNQNIEPAND